MLPSQRKLVERLKDKPFTLLAINSDRMSRSALKKKLKKNKITWPNLCEGGEMSVSKRWNIHGWPSLFVLDHEGIIRARDLHGAPQIEKLVDDLLAKAPKN